MNSDEPKLGLGSELSSKPQWEVDLNLDKTTFAPQLADGFYGLFLMHPRIVWLDVILTVKVVSVM